MSSQNSLADFILRVMASFIAGALGYLLKLMAYSILPFMLFMTFAPLLLDYLLLAGGRNVMFIADYIYSVHPHLQADPSESIHDISLGAEDLLRVYNALTEDLVRVYLLLMAALFVLAKIGSWLTHLLIKPKARALGADGRNTVLLLFILSVITTLAYSGPFIITAFSPGTSLVMHFMMGLVYATAMISNVLFVGTNRLSDKMLGWVFSNVKMMVTPQL